MKRLIGFMMIITLPILAIIHVVFLCLCVPFIAIYSATHQFARCVKELFDLRNTYAFSKGIANQAYKFLTKKDAA